jgi:putative membrane protein
MDRRLVLAGLAAAVSTPALAQTTQTAPIAPGTTPAPGTMPSGTMPSGNMPAGQMATPMGEAEMKHMRDTMMAGMVALETSRVALEKARNAEVKQYAKFEKDEQEGIAEVLKSMMDPASTASAMPMPMKLEGEDAAMVQKMQGMQAGPEFDRMYVQGQIEGHQKLLRIQEEYIRQGRNREHMNVAKLARGHIKEHVEVFTELGKKLRA